MYNIVMFKLAVCFVVFAHCGQFAVIMLFSVLSKIEKRMPAIFDEIKRHDAIFKWPTLQMLENIVAHFSPLGILMHRDCDINILFPTKQVAISSLFI